MEKYIIPLIFICTVMLLVLVSIYSYQIGFKDKTQKRLASSEIISTSIFGLLALFVSFSYSMVVNRYEERRKLAVEEANAISTAAFRSSLLNETSDINLKALYQDYIKSRIRFYDQNFSQSELNISKGIQKKMQSHLQILTKKERGALESAYNFALTEMIDTSNARTFALQKTLPIPIYVVILIIAIIGFSALNYDRGYKAEPAHWKLFAFITLFSLLFTFVYDIDHANIGLIRISQDAILDLNQ